jgi:hypothetical protein
MSSSELDRYAAIELAEEVLGLQEEYENHYYCADCDEEWTNYWSCGCDDDCPVCGISYSPVNSVCLSDDDD